MHFFQTIQEEFTADQYQITNLYPDSIASRGPNPKAMDPKELANFILEQAEQSTSYYLRDVTLHTR
jgi:hypothetical protein